MMQAMSCWQYDARRAQYEAWKVSWRMFDHEDHIAAFKNPELVPQHASDTNPEWFNFQTQKGERKVNTAVAMSATRLRELQWCLDHIANLPFPYRVDKAAGGPGGQESISSLEWSFGAPAWKHTCHLENLNVLEVWKVIQLRLHFTCQKVEDLKPSY